jgi:hypothetical protein
MVDFTDVSVNVTDIFIYAGILLAAIGAIWGVRKMIALGNAEAAEAESDEIFWSAEGREDDYNEWVDKYIK